MIIKRIFYIFTLTLTLVFFGCSMNEQVKKVEATPNLEFEGAPTWIENPSFEKSIAAKGSALKDEKFLFILQRDKATQNAKIRLKEILEHKVLQIITSLNETNDDINLNRLLRKASIEITQNTINRANIKKLWRSKTDTIHVLVAIKLDVVKDEIERVIYKSFSNNREIYQNFITLKGSGKLDIELKSSI